MITSRELYETILKQQGYTYDECFPSNRLIDRKDIKHMDFNNTRIVVDGYGFKANGVEVNSDYYGTTITASAHLDPNVINRSNITQRLAERYTTESTASNKTSKYPTIENVIFNPPATIVFWSDKTKTIVKADYDYECYDPEKGIAMAIAKKLMGDNKGKYYELFKHWKKKWDEQNVSPNNPPETNNPLTNLANNIKSALKIDDLLP